MSTLQTIGKALYGQQWQSALARDMGVSLTTMRRWINKGPPAHAWPKLRQEMSGRIQVLGDLLQVVSVTVDTQSRFK